MHRQRSAIGVDVGDHAVKCVQLESRGGELVVRDVLHEVVQAGGDRKDQLERTMEAARRILALGDFRGRDCMTALRLFEAKTRHVRIPSDEVDQAGKRLAQELQENERELSGEFTMQYLPVAELVEHGRRQHEFLCCIADPRVVREHLDLLDALRLRPRAIDLDACALVRPFVGRASDGEGALTLCIDLGCRCARIVIVHGSRPILLRTVEVGGADFLRALEQELELDFHSVSELAENVRFERTADIEDVEQAISKTLSSLLDPIVGRVRECARYAGTLFGGQSVKELRVLGGAAALPGVSAYLAKNLGLSSQDSDPFRAIGVEQPRAVRSIAPTSFATALGLAMRGLAA